MELIKIIHNSVSRGFCASIDLLNTFCRLNVLLITGIDWQHTSSNYDKLTFTSFSCHTLLLNCPIAELFLIEILIYESPPV